MADAEISIGLDASGLESQLAGIVEQLQSLGAAGDVASAGVDTTAASTVKAAEGTKVLTESSVGATSALEALGEHSRTVSLGLEALGLDAGAAAARIDGLAEAFEGLQSAVPELLVLAAAITALAAGFEFLKGGITAAGDLNANMVQLANATKNQGGDWTALSGKVNDYLENLEKTSSYSRGEGAESLKDLAVAGKTGADAFTYLNVAQNLAAATGMSLKDATEQLIGASEGRTRGLVAMGILTRQDIKDGMDQQTMLQLVQERTEGAAEAMSTTLPGALRQLSAAWESLSEDAGAPFQKMLVDCVNGLTNFVRNLDTLLKQGEEKWAGFIAYVQTNFPLIIAVVSAAWGVISTIFRVGADALLAGWHVLWDGIVGAAHVVEDLLEGNLGKMWSDIKATWGKEFQDIGASFGNFGENLLTIAKSIASHVGDVLKGVFSAMAQASQGNWGGASAALGETAGTVMGGVQLKPWNLGGDAASSAGTAWSNMFAGSPGQYPTGVPHLDDNQMIPGQKTAGAGGTGYQASPIQDALSGFDKSFSDLQSKLDPVKVLMDQLAAKEDGLTVAMKSAGTEAQYQADAQTLLATKMADAKAVVDALQSAIQQETAQKKLEETATTSSAQAYEQARERYNAYAQSLEGVTKLTAAEKQELADLKQGVDLTKQAFDQHDAALKKVNTTLEQHIQDLQKASKASADLAATEAETTAALERKWEEYQNKRDAANADTVATAGKTDAQVVAYYADMLAKQTALYQQYLGENDAKAAEHEALMESYDAKLTEAYKKELDDQAADAKKIYDEETKDVSTFLDDVLAQHKSLKDELKSIYDQILQNFIQMVAKMIVESKLLAPVFKAMSSMGFGGLGGPNTTIGGNAPGNSNTGGVLVNVADAGSSFLSKTTGNPTGIPAGQQVVTQPTGANSNTATGSLLKTGSAPGNMSFSSAAGGAMEGVALGGLLGGVGGNSTYGTLLGGLGGAVGSIFGGPLGGMIGSAAGGLIGGFLGPHWNNAQDEPDVYDTQNYGSTIAALLGKAGANGQTFYETSQQQAAFGGGTAIQGIEETLAQYGSKSAAPTWLQPMFTQLESIFGESSTGSGQLKFGTNIGQLTIAGAGATAKNTSYTEIESLLSQYQNAESSAGSNIPIFSVSALGPNFSQEAISAWNPTQLGSVSAPTLPGNVANGTASTTTTNNGGVTVINNGTVVGSGGMNELASTIAQLIPRNHRMNYNGVSKQTV